MRVILRDVNGSTYTSDGVTQTTLGIADVDAWNDTVQQQKDAINYYRSVDNITITVKGVKYVFNPVNVVWAQVDMSSTTAQGSIVNTLTSSVV